MIFGKKWMGWQLMTLNLIPRAKNGLEIGCGPGWLLNASKKRFEKAIAIDISFSMLRHTAKHANSILRADAECLPFKDNAFDAIFSNLPSDFIVKLNTWKEAKRVLKKGGIFVCLIWIRMKPNSLYAYLQRIIYGQVSFDFTYLISLAKNEGFLIEKKTQLDTEGNELFYLIAKNSHHQ